MNLFWEAIQWLFSPDRLAGANAIPVRVLEHLFYTLVSLGVATIIAVPIGYLIGHSGRGRELTVALSGAARALPSLGLLAILALGLGIARAPLAAVIVLLLLGVPSILAGAYAGVQAIDRATIDAARAIGMTEWQILVRVEIPLGLPLLLGGIRNAALQIVATTTLAAYVGLGGLGLYIFAGLAVRDYSQMLGGAILIALLALALDAVFAVVQKYSAPQGVNASRTKDVRARSSRLRTVMGTAIEQGKG